MTNEHDAAKIGVKLESPLLFADSLQNQSTLSTHFGFLREIISFSISGRISSRPQMGLPLVVAGENRSFDTSALKPSRGRYRNMAKGKQLYDQI